MGALGRWAVPVFLAVAGWALLARRPADNEERWLGRRAVRLVLPLLAWSLIYVVWALALARLTGQHLWSGKSSLLDWLRGEAQLFYSGTGVRPQLWFMYALIVATLIVWLVQTAGRIRNQAVYLGACAVLVLFWGVPQMLNFSAGWTSQTWVLGYFVLGWLVLQRVEPGWRFSRWLGLGLFAVTLAAVTWGDLARVYWIHSPYSPVELAAALGVLLLFRGISFSERWRARINALGALTFGVFLVQFVSMDLINLTWRTGAPLAFLTIGERTAVLLPAASLLSFALAWLWHRWGPLAVLLG